METCFVDDALCIGVGPGKRAAWTGSDNIARARRILALLIFFGLMSLVAVQSLRLEPPECGPFTIGQSAIGGCDWIGR